MHSRWFFLEADCQLLFCRRPVGITNRRRFSVYIEIKRLRNIGDPPTTNKNCYTNFLALSFVRKYILITDKNKALGAGKGPTSCERLPQTSWHEQQENDVQTPFYIFQLSRSSENISLFLIKNKAFGAGFESKEKKLGSGLEKKLECEPVIYCSRGYQIKF